MDQSKESIRKRLARIDGQVHVLVQMVEEERDPVDILTQLAATRAGLAAVGSCLVSDQLEEVVAGLSEADELRAKFERLCLTLERFVGQ